MNKTLILVKAQAINFFRINEISRESSKKNSSVIVDFGVISLVLFFSIYNILTAITLVKIGQQDLIPSYMVAVSGFAILFFTLFYSNGILFGSGDIEVLLSLPVTNEEIIQSKL